MEIRLHPCVQSSRDQYARDGKTRLGDTKIPRDVCMTTTKDTSLRKSCSPRGMRGSHSRLAGTSRYLEQFEIVSKHLYESRKPNLTVPNTETFPANGETSVPCRCWTELKTLYILNKHSFFVRNPKRFPNMPTKRHTSLQVQRLLHKLHVVHLYCLAVERHPNILTTVSKTYWKVCIG